MKYLTLEHIRQQLRLEHDGEEDAVLELYGNGAEDTVLNICNRTIDDVIEQYGGVPDPIRQATLLLVGISYLHREPASAQNMSHVPYTFDILIKPYIRLADKTGGCTGRVIQTAVLGSDIKIPLNPTLPEGVTLEAIDFDVTVYNETAIDKKVDIKKADCKHKEDGSWLVMVNTADLGVGIIMLKVVLHIPDEDYDGGTRKQVERLNPYIRIIG